MNIYLTILYHPISIMNRSNMFMYGKRREQQFFLHPVMPIIFDDEDVFLQFFSILHSKTFISNALLCKALNRYCCQQILKAWKKKIYWHPQVNSYPLLITMRSQFWFAINLSIFLSDVTSSHIIIIIQEVSDVENLGNWKLTVHFEWIISMDFHCSYFFILRLCLYFFASFLDSN